MTAARSSRVDPTLMLGGSLLAGGLTAVARWEAIVAAAAVLLLALCAGRASVALVALAVIAMGCSAWRAGRLVGQYEESRLKVDEALGRVATCSGRARVESSPVEQRDGLRWDAWLEVGSCGPSPTAWNGWVTLFGGPDDLARGDRAEVVVALAAPQRLWNLSAGDPRPAEARRGVLRSGAAVDVRRLSRGVGVGAGIDRLRARLRARIEATFPPDVAPMVRALVLGESDLAAGDDQAFRASGLSHLLAVSGMHLVLVLAFGVRAIKGVLVRVEGLAARLEVGRIISALGILVAWLYADLAGAGGSTVRAAWMMTAALGARVLGRRGDSVRAFGLSLVVMAWTDPLVGLDLSFVLSAAATGGLLAFASPWAQRWTSWTGGRAGGVVKSVATTLAASVPCVPIVARFAPTMPLGGVVANLLAVPLGECAALPLCFVHAVTSWWPPAEHGCALAATGALRLVRAIARVFSMPALTLDVPQPTAWQLAVLAVVLTGVLLDGPLRRSMGWGGAVLLVALEVQARRRGAPRGLLRATFFDVGQGDSALLDLPDGEAMLVDGGGLVGSALDVGQRVIAPELRTRRRRRLAAVALTHPHPDHFGGLVSGLDDVVVGEMWDTGQGEAESLAGGYAALLSEVRARGARVLRPAELCGERMVGGAKIEVLAPCPAFSSDWGPNDNSFVMRISYGARSLLLVGDAEREEEAVLLASRRSQLHADVLKVGHHGSRTSSTPAFLAAVGASEAIVSSGCRNRFGHPSPVTLHALEVAGARVWRTDQVGAVTVTTDGRSLGVRALGFP